MPLPDVAVIIPFYQSVPGLLATAIASVFRQNVTQVGKVVVIVVDDGSPSSWRAEALAPTPAGFELKIVEKANGGVSSARNAGLDAVDAGTEFIAFLDSDDQWFDNHLDIAMTTLGTDEDLFFSDCFDGEKVRYFSFTDNPQIIALQDDQSIAIDGASLFDTFLRGCFVHISFSVFRRRIARDLRFNETLDLTCEDQVFFLHLAKRARRAVVLNRVTGARGYGVSIYRASLAWDSATLLPRIENQIVAARYLVTAFDLVGSQRARMLSAWQYSIDELLFFTARKLRHGQGAALPQLASIVSRHPGILPGFPKGLMRLVSGATRRRVT